MRISDWSSDVCSSDLLAELHTYPDGSRRVAITLDPAAPLGVPLSASGAYPLEIVAQDSSGRPLGRLLTHVLVEPQRDDESPPLSVAVLAAIGAEPALQPEGEIELGRASCREGECQSVWILVVAV